MVDQQKKTGLNGRPGGNNWTINVRPGRGDWTINGRPDQFINDTPVRGDWTIMVFQEKETGL